MCKCFLVGGEHLLLDQLPRLVVQRKCNVLKGTILALTTRHCDKKSFLALDHLEVTDHKAVAERYGSKGLQFLIFLAERPYPDLCNL